MQPRLPALVLVDEPEGEHEAEGGARQGGQEDDDGGVPAVAAAPREGQQCQGIFLQSLSE